MNKNKLDKYYTKPNIAKKCIKLVKQHINILDNDLIIEPSAGNGSFIKYIKELSSNYIFYDIVPEHIEIHKQNFLDLDYNNFKNESKNIHVIGNPPFGYKGTLALKFIKKCMLFANSISFILPKCYQNNNMKKYLLEKYNLLCEIELKDNSFLYNNIESNISCIFQIWCKKIEFLI
jgi:predicted RNA methylase